MKKIKVNKFSAEWCGPCRVMSPIFKKIQQLPEFKDVEFNDYDVDEVDNADIVTQFQIRNLPTIVITDENNVALTRIVGSTTEHDLVETIKKQLD